MAVYQWDRLGFLNSDAAFREYWKPVSDMLVAAGWVRTSDTGQPDWATVTRPAVNNVRLEMFRFDDALQATAPVFVQIGWGVAATLDRPLLNIRVGTSTTGANVLGPQQSALLTLSTPTSVLATSAPTSNVMSAASNRWSFALQYNWPSATGAFWGSIERTKDTNGDDTAEGIIIVGGAGSSSLVQYVPMTGPVGPNEGRLGAVLPTGATASYKHSVLIGLHAPIYGRLLNPALGVVCALSNDVSGDGMHTITRYGQERRYFFVAQSSNVDRAPNINSRAGVRID